MKTAIWWIRRDLRLSDNQALSAALSQAEQVIPVFIRDPGLISSSWVGDKRIAFLYAGLDKLSNDLRARGSRLLVRSGKPLGVLRKLIEETGAQSIFAEEDFSPYAMSRDRLIGEVLPAQFVPGVTVHHPAAIQKSSGGPFTVFTPYSKVWLSTPIIGKLTSPPTQIPTIDGLDSEPIPGSRPYDADHLFPPGEAEASRRLEEFLVEKIFGYGENRNRMDMDGTSTLSPYLRFGMISALRTVRAAQEAIDQAQNKEARHSAESWLNELIWREFYIAVLYHFPYARRESFRPALRGISWVNNPDDFAAWQQGNTGFPVVDAAMRQLLTTGWMHNRARMITASFLTKDLLVDWRWGERHFMHHLVDGDPAANNGGWQWTAGTGTDAAPYFRIFNPITQGLKFDPNGDYIRQYLPELASVPSEFIHQPWLMDQGIQKKLGCIIGKDYPAPIIDHAMARERVLYAYKFAKDQYSSENPDS